MSENLKSLRSRILCGASLAIAPLVLVSASHAQDEGKRSSRRLNVVTVTAAKKVQTLQETPIAVSVVDAGTIEDAAIIDLSDLQSIVPSLRVDTYQSAAQTAFKIRGFGNGDNNAGVEPSVAVYIDGVYRSRSAAAIADLPNLQRVEVLRGPQSTLFGKNASAGVISIVTKKPDWENSASAEVTLGNYNLLRFAGDVSGPINDKVAYSLSGSVTQRDGYAEDLGTGEDINDKNRYNLRGQLMFEPSDDTSIRLIGDYGKIDELCCLGANVINGPTGAAIFAIGGAIVPEDPFSYEATFNFPPTNDIENYGVSAEINHDLGFADFTSITSWRGSDLVQNSDGDFTTADLIGYFYNDTSIETFTQEVRLAGNTDYTEWMVGGFYFDESVDIENALYYGDDFRNYAQALSGGVFTQVENLLGLTAWTFGQAGVGLTEAYGQDNTAWSIFGTLDIDLSDKLTFTLGGNYTDDEKDAFGTVVNTDAFSALDFVAIGNNVLYQTAFGTTLAGFGIDPTDPAQVSAFAAANPAAFAQVQAGAQAFADANDTDPAVNPLLSAQLLQFFPPFVNFPNSVEDGHSQDDKFTYTLRMNYEMNDAISIYASYATGFKATSWNLSRDSRPFASDIADLDAAGLTGANLTAGTRYAGPEDARVYEIGLKAAFDNLAVNLAVFDQEIRGFQSNAFTGTGFALTNAGVQSSTGLEMDVTWSPADGLRLFAAGLFMDPVYDDFKNSANGDLSGQRPQSISENSISLGASYDFTLSNGWDAFVRGDYQYESEANLTDDPAYSNLTREINVFNAAAGVYLDNGLRVSVWGRNIFDDEYLIEAFPSVAQDGSISGYPNQPATYGITVKKEF